MATLAQKLKTISANARKAAEATETATTAVGEATSATENAGVAKLLRHRDLLFKQLSDHINSDAEMERYTELANESKESTILDFKYYLPKTIKSDDGTYKRVVPQEQTYICCPGENIDTDATPMSLLLQGIYDPSTRSLDTKTLPDGKTVIDLLKEAFAEVDDAWSFDVQVRTDREICIGSRITDGVKRSIFAKYLVIVVVWDKDRYNQKQQLFKDRKSHGRRG
jgi:hypothetical protein